MAAAAVAAALGVDPSWVLDQPIDDLPVIDAMLEQAWKMRVEYDEQIAKVVGAETASRLLPSLAKHNTQLVAAVVRIMRRP